MYVHSTIIPCAYRASRGAFLSRHWPYACLPEPSCTSLDLDDIELPEESYVWFVYPDGEEDTHWFEGRRNFPEAYAKVTVPAVSRRFRDLEEMRRYWGDEKNVERKRKCWWVRAPSQSSSQSSTKCKLG